MKKLLLILLLISCEKEDMKLFINGLNTTNIISTVPQDTSAFNLYLDSGSITNSYISTQLNEIELKQELSVFRSVSGTQSNVLDYWDTYYNGVEVRHGEDDAAPLHMYGSALGGNHGYYVATANVTSHDKAWVDVGSTWTDGVNSFVLVLVRNSTQLFLAKIGINSGGAASTTFTHVTGATNTSNIVCNTVGQDQFYPPYKDYSLTLEVDGVPTTIQTLSTSVTTDVVFTEVYTLMERESILNYYIANVGTFTVNHYPQGDGVATLTSYIRYTRKGVTIDTTFEVIADITDFDDLMLMQGHQPEQPVGEATIRMYIPKTIPFTAGVNTFDFANIEDVDFLPLAARVDITQTRAEATGLFADRLYHLTEGYGLAFGYLPAYDSSVADRRSNTTGMGMQISTSGKIYPHAYDIGNTSLTTGFTFRTIGYKNWFITSANRTANFVVEDGQGGYYMYADWHNVPDTDTLTVPYELFGKTIIEIEKSSNVSYSLINDGNAISVTIDNTKTYGYLVLKF